MNELMRRRRALMMAKDSGPIFDDFIPLEYIKSPTTNSYKAGCVLGTVNNAFKYVEITVKQIVSGTNLFFQTLGGNGDTSTTYPYFGTATRGYTTDKTPTVGTKTTITATKTGTQSPTSRVRIGGWQDAGNTKETEFYGVKLYDSSNDLVADYVVGYRPSTNKTGVYDTLTNTFYPEVTSSGWGFVRGPEV